ncbi:MAG: hypothetical protein QOD81_3814 [Solirubrobacteraceae bacterium]|nr:hypothetical protein [Solirubrobacteraceae bacterium]
MSGRSLGVGNRRRRLVRASLSATTVVLSDRAGVGTTQRSWPGELPVPARVTPRSAGWRSGGCLGGSPRSVSRAHSGRATWRTSGRDRDAATVEVVFDFVPDERSEPRYSPRLAAPSRSRPVTSRDADVRPGRRRCANAMAMAREPRGTLDLSSRLIARLGKRQERRDVGPSQALRGERGGVASLRVFPHRDPARNPDAGSRGRA